MIISEIHAYLIMGALAGSYSEGYTDIDGEVAKKYSVDQWQDAEFEIIREINTQHPQVVKKYSWLPLVKKLEDEKHE